MRNVAVLAIVLVLCSVSLFAGEYLMNDTGQTAYGLRVTFSEPVEIAAFGDALTKVDPTGQATQFTFSGSEVSTSGGEWFNWEPVAAKIALVEWLTGSILHGDQPRVDRTRFRGVNMALEMACPADIQYLTTAWHANFVRVCLNMAGEGEWGFFVPNTNQLTMFPKENWERLDAFLDECERASIRVVISLHHWLGYGCFELSSAMEIWQNRAYQMSLIEFWGQMARRYASRGGVIMGYDILNEPHTDDEGENISHEWRSLAQDVVDEIRKYDTEHAVVIECADYGNPSGFESLLPIDDENVIYSFHFYLPLEFAAQGSNSQLPTGQAYPTQQWDKDWLREELAPIREFQKKYGAHILVGEVNATSVSDKHDRFVYFRDCLELFEEYGFDYALWGYMGSSMWSLEHSPQSMPNGMVIPVYTGDTEALGVWKEFFARNRSFQPSRTHSQARCLFVQNTKLGTWEYKATGDLLWKLNHWFVVTVLHGLLTSGDLSKSDLLVTPASRAGATQENIDAIEGFVQSGGGLLQYGLGSGPLTKWLETMGIHLDSSIIIASRDYEDFPQDFRCYNFGDHPITDDAIVYRANWSGSVSLSGIGTVLVWSPGFTWRDLDEDQVQDSSEPVGPFGLVACAELGSGRIVVFADTMFDLAENYHLAVSAVMWLTGQ